MVSDGAAASRSQERGEGGEGAQEEQIGMFPEETERVKERKRKERKRLFEGMALVSSVLASQVHHRRNVLRCDDSIVLKPSMKKVQQCGNGRDFTHYLSSSSHNLILFDRLQFNRLMSSEH